MSEYQDVYYKSSDGLTLYARDYPHSNPKHTILCMHGLSRNSADFEEIIPYLHKHSRVIAVDQRGRGKSDYDPSPENYLPTTYVQDMFSLINYLSLDKVTLLGTSMGGLMSMMMAAANPALFEGIIINDIGPVVDPKGLNRIKAYVGKTKPAKTWAEAADRIRELNGPFYPDFTDDDWAKFAKRTYHEDSDGAPVLSYDPNISKPIEQSEEAAVSPDLWPLFEACASIPILVIRGEYSDILHPDTVDEMKRRHPNCMGITIPRVGHAPILNEDKSIAAIANFLDDLK
ncbi:alpha/beta fold hydrolase [Kordiimonas sp. SCSIO 12610]|uniref:alpha/beta fold hydrolase n=1 Tax=Kordiimonas sp. SCSIO 12610 TaxID=2829597 RepID=UPI00210CCB59|nr:alpha/beta hydrolase [Kordiimonas sp. SCSIO 12610]UTW54715.1 alpha/beta hydrolase [Kordiimonas sp. SCSIO 12610]